MSKSKVWKIKDLDSSFTDEQLIKMIKNREVNEDTMVSSKEIKEWIALKDTIYQFYFKQEEQDETI